MRGAHERGGQGTSGDEPPGAGAEKGLARLWEPSAPPFALLHRPESAGPGHLEVLQGAVGSYTRLADLPLPSGRPEGGVDAHDLLALVPYRQLTERGYACRDDEEAIIGLRVERQERVPLEEALAALPDEPIELDRADFDIDDETYAEIVERIIADEIGTGAGSNFVIKRSFTGEIRDYSPESALTLFRRLLVGELGAYWTFLVHTGSRTFVGATPERHLSVDDGTAVMNPISGTYRYPPAGPTLPGLRDFLSDTKEADELYMVVDEELKVMAAVCDQGARVRGPYLKEMANLAHTEYLLEGTTSLDVREALRRTLFAPTVTGSPIENACRVIARYEPVGRGYYSGAVALLGRDAAGRPRLDSGILIRAAEIDARGALRAGVGATLVRDSDPRSEVAETRSKAAGLLRALGADPDAADDSASTAGGPTGSAVTPIPGFGDHPEVRALLAERNATLADYWLGAVEARARPDERLVALRTLVVDAEDAFTAMLSHQLVSLGLEVTTLAHHEGAEASIDDFDLVIVGPGPGDPGDTTDPRIAAHQRVVRRLLRGDKPFLCVCLGHQVLSAALGLEIARKPTPNQGLQKAISLFGREERVGFYNTFAAQSDRDIVPVAGLSGPLAVSRDPRTGDVHALRGPGFASTQFHPESLLTERGPEILSELLGQAADEARTPGDARVGALEATR